MRFVVEVPDKYFFRWMELSQKISIDDFDIFILNALGIGIQTISHSVDVLTENADNVIKFNPDYYWKNEDMVKR